MASTNVWEDGPPILAHRPCGKGTDFHHSTVAYILIQVNAFLKLPQRPSEPHGLHTSSAHSLNSYFPFLSTASNSILANSTPVALSPSLQSTLSPGLTGPTPDGVPVRITSPGWTRRKGQ